MKLLMWFAFLTFSAYLFASSVDVVSTVVCLEHSNGRLVEDNNFIKALMDVNLWIPFEIGIQVFYSTIMLRLHSKIEKTHSKALKGLLVIFSLGLLFGAVRRVIAGIGNFELLRMVLP